MEAASEIFVVPFFDKSHLFPAMELCKNISSHNYNVTLIIPSHISSSIPSTFSNHSSLIHVTKISNPTADEPGTKEEVKPWGPPGGPFHHENLQMGEGIKSFLTSRSGVRPTCVVIDIMMSWSKEIFVDHQIPVVSFSTSSAVSAAMAYGMWKAEVGNMKPGEIREIPGLPKEMAVTFTDVSKGPHRPNRPPGDTGPPNWMRMEPPHGHGPGRDADGGPPMGPGRGGGGPHFGPGHGGDGGPPFGPGRGGGEPPFGPGRGGGEPPFGPGHGGGGPPFGPGRGGDGGPHGPGSGGGGGPHFGPGHGGNGGLHGPGRGGGGGPSFGPGRGGDGGPHGPGRGGPPFGPGHGGDGGLHGPGRGGGPTFGPGRGGDDGPPHGPGRGGGGGPPFGPGRGGAGGPPHGPSGGGGPPHGPGGGGPPGPPPGPGTKPNWLDEEDGSVALLINTCDNLEGVFIDYITDHTKLPVYGVGPLLPDQFLKSADALLHKPDTRSALQSNYKDEDVFQWLESKPHGSVIYISFGSTVGPSIEECKEIAKALEDSDQAFIWVIQPGSGKFGFPGPFIEEKEKVKEEEEEKEKEEEKEEKEEEEEEGGYYPEGLDVKVGKRGLIITGWAPQLLILSHPSTGGFLSHCGWNSMVEAIVRGVPILGWPIRGDQFDNAKFVANHLKVGYVLSRVGDNDDLPPGVFKTEDIAAGIEKLMSDENVHKQAKELSKQFESGFPTSSVKALGAFLEFISQKAT